MIVGIGRKRGELQICPGICLEEMSNQHWTPHRAPGPVTRTGRVDDGHIQRADGPSLRMSHVGQLVRLARNLFRPACRRGEGAEGVAPNAAGFDRAGDRPHWPRERS